MRESRTDSKMPACNGRFGKSGGDARRTIYAENHRLHLRQTAGTVNAV